LNGLGELKPTFFFFNNNNNMCLGRFLPFGPALLGLVAQLATDPASVICLGEVCAFFLGVALQSPADTTAIAPAELASTATSSAVTSIA
jgi:hypothetical protein